MSETIETQARGVRDTFSFILPGIWKEMPHEKIAKPFCVATTRRVQKVCDQQKRAGDANCVRDAA